MPKHKKYSMPTERDLSFKEDGQEYGQVLRMLGDSRVEVNCFDGTKRICIIRGTLRKKVWIKVGDMVLVGLRDYQDGKGDVITKYTEDDVKKLKSYGELPSNDDKEESTVEFTENNDEEINLESL